MYSLEKCLFISAISCVSITPKLLVLNTAKLLLKWRHAIFSFAFASWDAIDLDQGCQVGIFKAKFKKFGLFCSGLAWKNGVWHVRPSLAFFGLFWWCWHESTLFSIFQNLWFNYCCRHGIIELFLRTKVLFSATVLFSKIQAALHSKWRHRAKDIILF